MNIGRFRFDKDFALIGCALALLVLGVLLPRVELSRDTYDYLVVFDVTQSMNVEDYEIDRAPVDRLTYAKHAVRAALRELPCGSRIGWGAFAEYRTVVLLAPVEICSNYDDLLESLEKIDGRMRWGEASEITKGVFWALRAARDLGGGASVIFLSDGQEAPPLDATRQAVAIFDDITVGATDGWIVGVGGYAAQPIPRTDADGHRVGYWRAHEVIQRATDQSGSIAASSEHLSALHEAHLQSLASQIGFRYRRLSDADAIEQTLRDARLAKRNRVPTDLSWAPAALALLLLAIKFAPAGLIARNPARSRL